MNATIELSRPEPYDHVRPRIEFAHILRGVAAVSVLLHHFFQTFWNKPEIVGTLIAFPGVPSLVNGMTPFGIPQFWLSDFWGHFGVALFFLISGFVVPLSFTRQSAVSFLVARVFRIWPTFIVGLTITIMCVAINATFAEMPFPYRTWEVLSHYLVIPRWPTLARPIDGIIWTLEIEIFFYGFCIVFFSSLRICDPKIFFITLLSIPVASLAGSWGPLTISINIWLFSIIHWGSSMLTFLPFLLVGTSFSYFYQNNIGLRTLAGLHAMLMSVFIASWCLGLIAGNDYSGPVSYLIAYAVFAMGFIYRERISRLCKIAKIPFSMLADISYPLYVIHGVLGYSILAHLTASGFDRGAALLATISAAFASATLIHLFVEMPTQRFGKELAVRWNKSLPLRVRTSGQERT